MVKRVTLATMLLAGSFAYAQPAATKMGVVDAEVVIRGSAEGKKLLERLEKYQAAKQVEIDTKTKELADIRNKYQTQQLTLSEDARGKMEKDIEQKTTGLRRVQEDAQAELDDMKEQGLRTINQKVLPVIEKYAKDNGFTIVFDKNRSGIIVSDNSLDISSDIIKLLDQEATAATPPPSK